MFGIETSFEPYANCSYEYLGDEREDGFCEGGANFSFPVETINVEVLQEPYKEPRFDEIERQKPRKIFEKTVFLVWRTEILTPSQTAVTIF